MGSYQSCCITVQLCIVLTDKLNKDVYMLPNMILNIAISYGYICVKVNSSSIVPALMWLIHKWIQLDHLQEKSMSAVQTSWPWTSCTADVWEVMSLISSSYFLETNLLISRSVSTGYHNQANWHRSAQCNIFWFSIYFFIIFLSFFFFFYIFGEGKVSASCISKEVITASLTTLKACCIFIHFIKTTPN